MPTHGQLALLGLGLVGYGAAAVGAFRRIGRPDQGKAVSVTAALVAGLLASAVLIVWRIAEGGTLLAVGGFDAMVLIAWLVALEILVVRLAGRLRGVDAFLMPVVVAVQAGSLLMIRSTASGPSHLHPWHIVGHAVVISLAGALLVVSGVAGVVYLIVHRAVRRKRDLSALGRFPPLESLERFGRAMVAAAFPLLTFGILTGVCAIAHAPAENRSREMMMASGIVALWVLYAVAMLVVWLRPRLRGPRAAALATMAAGLTALNFVTYLLIRSHA